MITRDVLAKAMADRIGHGMTEKCEVHADVALELLTNPDQDKINAFTIAIIDHFFFNDHCDIEGDVFQEIALEYGIIEAFKPDAPCCVDCNCLQEFGVEDFEAGKVECNRDAPVLNQFRHLLGNGRK